MPHGKRQRPRKRHPVRTTLLLLALFLCLLGLGPNLWIVLQTTHQIVAAEELSAKSPAECVLILGCGIRGQRPSPMLQERLDTGIALYKAGLAPKLLMSGSHILSDYDEVSVMKQYAREAGVPPQDIFLDYAGISTYESFARAKAVFALRDILVVTQRYHLYRSLYCADALGIRARGVACDKTVYAGQFLRELREIAARDKDFFLALLAPAPSYRDEPISIRSDGRVTETLGPFPAALS